MRKKNLQTKVNTKQRLVKQGVKVHTPVEPEPFDAMAYLMSMPEEPSKPPAPVDNFDPLDYACPMSNWPHDWPTHIVPQFEAQGFTRIRLEKIVPHPAWLLHMKSTGRILTDIEASRIVLDAMKQVCRIPRNAFFCTSNRYGIIEAGFLVDI